MQDWDRIENRLVKLAIREKCLKLSPDFLTEHQTWKQAACCACQCSCTACHKNGFNQRGLSHVVCPQSPVFERYINRKCSEPADVSTHTNNTNIINQP